MDDGVSHLQTALEQKLVLTEQPYWTQWARSWRRHVLASPNLHLHPQDETTLSVLGSSVAAGCEVSPRYSFPVRMASLYGFSISAFWMYASAAFARFRRHVAERTATKGGLVRWALSTQLFSMLVAHTYPRFLTNIDDGGGEPAQL